MHYKKTIPYLLIFGIALFTQTSCLLGMHGNNANAHRAPAARPNSIQLSDIYCAGEQAGLLPLSKEAIRLQKIEMLQASLSEQDFSPDTKEETFEPHQEQLTDHTLIDFLIAQQIKQKLKKNGSPLDTPAPLKATSYPLLTQEGEYEEEEEEETINVDEKKEEKEKNIKKLYNCARNREIGPLIARTCAGQTGTFWCNHTTFDNNSTPCYN